MYFYKIYVKNWLKNFNKFLTYIFIKYILKIG